MRGREVFEGGEQEGGAGPRGGRGRDRGVKCKAGSERLSLGGWGDGGRREKRGALYEE